MATPRKQGKDIQTQKVEFFLMYTCFLFILFPEKKNQLSASSLICSGTYALRWHFFSSSIHIHIQVHIYTV